MRGLLRVTGLLVLAQGMLIAVVIVWGHTRPLPPAKIRNAPNQSDTVYYVDVGYGWAHAAPLTILPPTDTVIVPNDPDSYGLLVLPADEQSFGGDLYWQPPGGAQQLVVDDAWWAAWRNEHDAVVWRKSGRYNIISVFDAAAGELHTLHRGVEYALCSPTVASACFLLVDEAVRKLYALDVPSRQLTLVEDIGLPTYSYEWSPTQPEFVYPVVQQGATQIRAYNAQTGQSRTIADLPPANRFRYTWSHDGRWLAVTMYLGGVYAGQHVIDMRGEQAPVRVASLPVPELYCQHWSSVRVELLCTRTQQFDAQDTKAFVYTFDPATGNLWQRGMFSSSVIQPVWAPDGLWIGGLIDDREFFAIPPGERTRVFRVPVHGGSVIWRD